MGLHALAVEAALANLNNQGRYEVAAPHIKSLLECKHARFQALGHLFQGAIDLEKAGMVADAKAPTCPGPSRPGSAPRPSATSRPPPRSSPTWPRPRPATAWH